MKPATYTITFANEKWEHLSEEQVMNFVKTAMIRNQDIRKATIERE